MDPMMASIMLFAGNFAPRGWAFCDGQLLPISQYSALFSLLGTTYGGDGRTTFGLPDLRGRAPIGPRNGPGLSDYRLGQKGGAEHITLNQTQMPSHTHAASAADVTVEIKASSAEADLHTPAAGSFLAAGNEVNGRGTDPIQMYNSSTPDITLGGGSTTSSNVTIGNTGGNLSHENRQPFIAINYIIAMQGIFPSRS
ncbi:phage tail protein [Polaribacter sp. SA4-12]|uniref:phage tail protein n=1 Tax=Polaribacter sp. SA4-12 TaxID=1312072 RepID=UPI000B3CEEB6|nr:tail fiber protein [Polaribacter sp. SA4-12]ARV15445.1 phage tail protein [Polaribacter sp. SA4-12]